MTHNFTDEELKKALKNVFSEKKPIRGLKKQWDCEGSLQEEYDILKGAYQEKEKQNSLLNKKLEKIRPVLKKMVAELNHLQKYKEKSMASERKIEELAFQLQQKEEEIAQLQEKIQGIEKKNENDGHKALETELREAIASKNDEIKRFEAEKIWLVEKLAETLGQLQRQNEIINELKHNLHAS